MTRPRPTRLSQAHYETLASLRHALRNFLGFSEVAARRAGLTPQQHQALLAIRGMPAGTPVSVGAVAEKLLVRHHSAVELTERLERMGMIRRVRSTVDRRKVDLSLTPRGNHALERLTSSHVRELRQLGPALARMLAFLGHEKPG
ncbi:MAG TPA: MarR family transcriptional regulator [Candidatus Didemnitutus sp.]|nr:MarR family transcriptional regulator [Candidatus Didemnitutus sp.]